VPNWHVDAIIEHLEAVTRGDIIDLVINIPPGMMKSLLVSVFWPVWEWTDKPSTRWLYSSYSAELSTRDAVKSRRIIQSTWYQQRWGEVFQLTGDVNLKHRYENTHTGFRIATSVGGMGTGERGDRICTDDPHNVKDGESEAIREGTVRWWSEVMSTRKNDPGLSRRVVVMQRVHQADVTAWSLEHGFEHLCIPMEYEGMNRSKTSLHFVDPRKKQDELAFPKLFNPKAVAKLKEDLAGYGTASQLQQRPTARGAGMFRREWFKPVRETPKVMKRVRYWDKAGSEGATAKYTVGVLVGIYDGITYIEDVVRGKWTAGPRENVIKQTALMDAGNHGYGQYKVYVEQEPGSGGKDSADATRNMLLKAGFAAACDRVGKQEGNKFQRADPLAGAAEAGKVYILEGAWNKLFLDELENAGPGAMYLDQMDAAAGAYNKAHRGTVGAGAVPVSIEQDNPWDIDG
jgi:phage terminase large subunit-like protein